MAKLNSGRPIKVNCPSRARSAGQLSEKKFRVANSRFFAPEPKPELDAKQPEPKPELDAEQPELEPEPEQAGRPELVYTLF